MISHCDFDLQFLDDWSFLASFHVLDAHLYVSFGVMPIKVLFPFSNQIVLMVSCTSSLYIYIYDINPLFVNIFSHSSGGLFLTVLLTVSFDVQKLLRLMYSHLFLFPFPMPGETDLKIYILLRPISKHNAYVFFQEYYGFASYI